MTPIHVLGSIAQDIISPSPVPLSHSFLASDGTLNKSPNFYAPAISEIWGGTGHNIAVAAHILARSNAESGGMPNIHLVGAISEEKDMEFATHLANLHAVGLGISNVAISAKKIAHARILTDEDNNQLIIFHPGSMDDSMLGVTGFDKNVAAVEGMDVAIVSPCSKDSMLGMIASCERNGVSFYFDPGQALGLFDASEIDSILASKKCIGLLANEPEMATICASFMVPDFKSFMRHIQHKVGVTFTVIHTRGEVGIDAYTKRGSLWDKVAVRYQTPITDAVDPTGCGDAFRAGFLYGRSYGFFPELGSSLRKFTFDVVLGTFMAARCVRHVGPQTYLQAPEAIQTHMFQTMLTDADSILHSEGSSDYSVVDNQVGTRLTIRQSECAY